MMLRSFSALSLILLLAACSRAPTPDTAPRDQTRAVRSAVVQAAESRPLGLSGTVRARSEAPLAFQVGGRIISRRVDAGQQVQAGQLLFELDPRDLLQSLRASEAELAAAEATLATIDAELRRARQLHAQQFTSAQALERTELQKQEAQTRRDAVAARAAQARNALEYGALRAPASGVLIEVSGEPGQVVQPGQPVAKLAQAGERELEVYFPAGFEPPAQGEALRSDGRSMALKLREVAGAVDPLGRTRRARYTVDAPADSLVLGAVVRARFAGLQAAEAELLVPLGAIDERGQGPRVWRIEAERVSPVAVTLLALDDRRARIRGPLQPGDKVVALGVHLLDETMKVRELAQ